MDINLQKCIKNAENGISKLDKEIFSIYGMSSARNRHLLNNLGAELTDFNYLEIGVHQGSTYISSLYQNKVKDSWAIDDWSEFYNQKINFINHCKKFKVQCNLIEADCFTVDVSKIRNINFYLYDGNHWDDKTTMGLTYFYDSLADEFLYVVDDFDWDGVQLGTFRGIERCNLKIKEQIYLESHIGNNEDGWWNGLGIFILQK